MISNRRTYMLRPRFSVMVSTFQLIFRQPGSVATLAFDSCHFLQLGEAEEYAWLVYRIGFFPSEVEIMVGQLPDVFHGWGLVHDRDGWESTNQRAASTDIAVVAVTYTEAASKTSFYNSRQKNLSSPVAYNFFFIIYIYIFWVKFAGVDGKGTYYQELWLTAELLLANT